MSLTIKYKDILDFISEYGGISIDICKDLFYNTKYGYDSSRRALNSLLKNDYIKVTKDFVTDKNVYYIKKPISSHKLMLLRLYAAMVSLGCEIVLFQREYKISNYIADGLIVYKYNNEVKIILIEIDINNKTKENKYIDIFNSGYFQDLFNTFPRVFIIDKDQRKQYNSNQVEYVYLGFDLEGLINNI